MITPEIEKDPPEKKKKRKVQKTVNPHQHLQPMDEAPIDLGIDNNTAVNSFVVTFTAFSFFII